MSKAHKRPLARFAPGPLGGSVAIGAENAWVTAAGGAGLGLCR